MENMKTELGFLMFAVGLYVLFRYSGSETSEWIVLLLIMLVGVGLKLALTGLIDKKIAELKDEQGLKKILSED